MVDWPTTLPGYLSGVTDKRGKTRLHSNVDVGPALVRRRYTAAVRDINLPVRFTQAERAIFDAWYITDLVEGSLSFNWKDPVSGTTVSYRFRGEDGPEFSGSGGGNGTEDVRFWTATLELEILP